MAKHTHTSSPLPTPVESESTSPSARLIERHGLDRITQTDANLHAFLQASTIRIHKLIHDELKRDPALDLDTASKVADRLTRALKTHYELLSLKGKIHERDDRRGKIIARVGIRQTPQGQEAVAEVEVTPGHDPA